MDITKLASKLNESKKESFVYMAPSNPKIQQAISFCSYEGTKKLVGYIPWDDSPGNKTFKLSVLSNGDVGLDVPDSILKMSEVSITKELDKEYKRFINLHPEVVEKYNI